MILVLHTHKTGYTAITQMVAIPSFYYREAYFKHVQLFFRTISHMGNPVRGMKNGACGSVEGFDESVEEGWEGGIFR